MEEISTMKKVDWFRGDGSVLKALTALVEDPGSVPSTSMVLITICYSSFRDSVSSSGLWRETSMWYTCMQIRHSYM